LFITLSMLNLYVSWPYYRTNQVYLMNIRKVKAIMRKFYVFTYQFYLEVSESCKMTQFWTIVLIIPKFFKFCGKKFDKSWQRCENNMYI
jgi:hypothetical protein